MLARTYFHAMAHHVRELPGCGAALLVLDCPAAVFGHPLLQWLPVDARLFGALELLPLLDDERVRALCDVACQCGQMRFINESGFVADGLLIQSVAIAPLDCPAGVAGYFVLVEAMGGGFTPGDVRLLNDYLATALPDVENNLRALCAIKDNSNFYSQGNGQGGIAPIDGNSMMRVLDGMKSDLISMVSHELRAPLTAIKGYTGLLQAYGLNDRQQENASESESTLTPARQQHYLDIIMDQALHLELLMSDLLDVSRIQAGKLALRYTGVDVDLLCQQVIRLARQRIEQTGHDRHRLRYEVSPELPLLQADANRLQQVLHNVLDNAVKYSPDGGLIELQVGIEYVQPDVYTLRQFDNIWPVARFTIRDQGIGISPQQRARLFQPFSRLEHPATAHIQGAGVGLYITQKLVEAMQGTIELTSQENKGTRVTIRFPLQQQPREARQLQPMLPGETYGGRS